jgi:hypothetical protein
MVKTLMDEILFNPHTAKSLLLNEKLYSKLLTSTEEFEPFLGLLFQLLYDNALFERIVASDQCSVLFADALVYSMILLPFETSRREVLCKIQAFVNDTAEKPDTLIKVTSIVKSGIERVFLLESNREREITAWKPEAVLNSDEFGYRAYRSLGSLIPKKKAPCSEDILMELVLVSNNEIITSLVGNDSWVSLCNRAGVNPRDLIENRSTLLFQSWFDASTTDPAMLSVVSLFTAISPSISLSSLIPLISGNLDSSLVRGITCSDIRIWKTPEGEICFDPTSKTSSKGSTKIETQVLNEGKKKPSSGKPPSRQAKLDRDAVNAQIEKEGLVRGRLTIVSSSINKALDFLDAILNGLALPFAADYSSVLGLWINQIIDKLLNDLITREVGCGDSIPVVFAGSRGVDIFVKLGKLSDSQLGDLVEDASLQMATLRCVGVDKRSGLEPRYLIDSIYGLLIII